MSSSPVSLVPGRYQYSYPTFVDTPQLINIHFLTSDGQQAFVSYPQHPNYRVPQLVPISWFSAVSMHRLDGHVTLMNLIELLLTGWSSASSGQRPTRSRRSVPTLTGHYQRIAV